MTEFVKPTAKEEMNDLHDRLIKIIQATEQEAQDRATIKLTPRYVELEALMRAAKMEQGDMLAGVLDSEPFVDPLKKMMERLMLDEHVLTFRNLRMKMGKKNVVNCGRLLNTLGGDIGLFIEMVGVTQKSLKDFAEQMPQIKDELNLCIDTEHVPKGIEVDFDLSSERL